MLGLLIASIILGAVVAGLTGIGFLFWVVAIAIFICGLPFALISGFVYGAIDHAQDRADYREEHNESVGF
jgi:high-affinity Fe2+/Pb2+ permease